MRSRFGRILSLAASRKYSLNLSLRGRSVSPMYIRYDTLISPATFGTIKNAYTPCSFGIDGRDWSLKGNADHESGDPSDSDDHRLGTMTIWCECRIIPSTANRSVYCDTVYRSLLLKWIDWRKIPHGSYTLIQFRTSLKRTPRGILGDSGRCGTCVRAAKLRTDRVAYGAEGGRRTE